MVLARAADFLFFQYSDHMDVRADLYGLFARRNFRRNFGNFRELRGRRDMVRSGLLRNGERGFGASALALARRQGAAELLFETRDKLGATHRPSGERSAL